VSKESVSIDPMVQRFAPPDRLGFVRGWVTVWRDRDNEYREVAIAAPTLAQLQRAFRKITGSTCRTKHCTRVVFRKSKS
jgi:hypothetical protein